MLRPSFFGKAMLWGSLLAYLVTVIDIEVQFWPKQHGMSMAAPKYDMETDLQVGCLEAGGLSIQKLH